jgi:type I restriction enzyme R subunit
MSYEYSEDVLIEQATQDVLEELGWQVVTAWQNEINKIKTAYNNVYST